MIDWQTIRQRWEADGSKRDERFHPQTQGKIDRWHQTLKNRILLEHYYRPGDLERQVAAFVTHYNHARYHKSLANLTPADVCFGPRLSSTIQSPKAAVVSRFGETAVITAALVGRSAVCAQGFAHLRALSGWKCPPVFGGKP